MKQLSLLLGCMLCFVASQAQAIKLSTFNAKFSKTEGGLAQHEMGIAATIIPEQEFAGAVVYIKIDVTNFKLIKAKYRLEIAVMELKEAEEQPNYLKEMYIPDKNGWLYISTECTAGKYTVSIRDKDNPTDVYSKVNFTVTGKPKVDYKNNSTLVVCKSVDDNWNPVGLTAKFKAGECMNFLYKAKDRMQFGVLIWNVVRVKDDGTEEYVTHLTQNGGNKPFRWLATDSGICVFDKPGKYRAYLFEKNSYDNRHDEDSEYVGKGEFIVE